MERDQVNTLHRVRQERDEAKIEDSLMSLRSAIDNNDNLIPAIIQAVKDMASLGEISQVLEEAFGTYEENIQI